MRPIILKGHERPVTIVRFNYDGDLLFSGSAETKINLWEAYTGERLGSYETKASVRSLDIDINSQHLIACSNDGSLEVPNSPFRFLMSKQENPLSTPASYLN